MKIPTLFGLALLITAITLGMLIYNSNAKLEQTEKQKYLPKDIKVVNIDEDEVTITWQTTAPIIGKIIYGDTTFKRSWQTDNRDKNGRQLFSTHFVTVKGLKPNTKYTYQIAHFKTSATELKSPLQKLVFFKKLFFPATEFYYPDYQLDFKTAPRGETATNRLTPYPPIRGTILNINLNPIDEALVYLELKNAQSMASFASTAGNFVIPLKGIRFDDLTKVYPLSDNIPAVLTVIKGNLKSEIQISLPPKATNLPPIIIGQNINLKNYSGPETAAETDQIALIETPPVDKTLLDLNKDKKVNSLDRALIIQNFGKNPKLKEADVNKDGLVDQKDVDIFSTSI